MSKVQRDSRPGWIEIRADEETLTPYAGLAITGQLVPALRLVPLLDAELGQVHQAQPVKLRERGLSPAELLVSLAECQLVGGQCFSDVEDLRADRAGAALRAVAAAPSAATARQLAKRFRRSHIRAAERALQRAGQALDRALQRDPTEPVTIDLDATGIEVFGRRKDGARRSRHGCVSYAPHVAFWAERGRPLTSELVPGNKEKLSGKESAAIARRALSLLQDGHGEPTFRVDSAYYALELLRELRRQQARFSVSLPRSTAMWRALERIDDADWQAATEMDGAQVAETSYTPDGWEHEPLRLIVRRVRFTRAQLASTGSRRRRTIHPEQLQLCLDGKQGHCFGYSFVLTDLDRDTREVERFHRRRAQIEERLKEAKLGQALRHLPSGCEHANRVWLQAALTALCLTAMCCDLCPAAGASGKAPRDAPLRRAARTLRRLLFCVPARIVRTGRRTILRLPAGFRYEATFRHTYEAAYALRPP
ncbi:MAG: IS1380 family transposase [Nocardioidaceae bacterium]